MAAPTVSTTTTATESWIWGSNLIYGVRVDETINLYSFAAIADGACLSNEGELTDPATLDSLLPAFDRVMAVVESG